ncbi:MAG: sugar transferase [Bacteroidales bacterium]|nr:sugar transferase [Candidatus Sodaliphilus limicaballi]
MISERIQRMKYLAGDFVMSNIAWLACNCLRYYMGVHSGTYHSLENFLSTRMVVVGQVVFPIIMMAVNYLSGYYNEVFRKSRLHEFFNTLWCSVVNAFLIFFLALINDVVWHRLQNYEMILLLIVAIFTCVYSVRMCITTVTSHRIKHRQWSFKTLIVGRGAAAVAFASKLNSMKNSLGYEIMGFVSIPHENDVKDVQLPCYELDDIERVCEKQGIQELIVVPTRKDSETVLNTINSLFALNLPIKVTPGSMNLLLSQVRISDMVGDPLVDVSRGNMSEGEKNMKRLLDIVVSAIVVLILVPVYAIVALMVKLDSKGPVFYTQERVGYHNKPFKIIKFRTMVCDAEAEGIPQLSREDDPRITRLGVFLRKYRIDELPQFWNVLRGDMSIVGPRPERQFYIDQIIKRVPSYALLRQVRPGITSLGMVKFGYAQNLEEMLERLNYDLLYLENMSMLNDFKIMVYTVKIVLTGRGM